MKKAIVRLGSIAAALAAVALPSFGAGYASAAMPNNQACLGNDFSGYAKDLRPFGLVLTTFEVGGTPIITGGLGNEIQNHLAGNVPDSVIPNTCNN
ncbi:MAG: hypothetical protein EPO16_06260 [Dehalococcoidia bacterium]|nr:MAG: hypothetical protein EPO16_06260 [Dehalococcoidia bacterium]